MDTSQHKISDLSPHLFWDVDRSKIEWDKNPHFLVQRILEYGLDNDWQILKSKYGIKKLAKVATELRSLDKIAMYFVGTISNTPIQKFRCYTLKQLIPHYSGY